MSANGHEIYRTDEEVINILYQTGGNVAQAAKILKLDAGNLRQRVRNKPNLREAQVEAREQLNDDAENIIAKAIHGKNKQQAIDTAKWYLPRRAKDRGYGDVLHTVNLNANLNAKVEEVAKMPLDERRQLLENIRSRVGRTDNNE